MWGEVMFDKPQEKPKVEYQKIKKCILKKEAGEQTEECKELFKKLNIEE